jgi:hypothetical protein
MVKTENIKERSQTMDNRERIKKAQDNLIEALDFVHDIKLIEHDTHLFLDHGTDIKESVNSELQNLQTMIDLLQDAHDHLYNACQ